MLFWWRKKAAPVPPLAAQAIYLWGDEEIPRYPPFMKGLPVVPPEKLLETQKELLGKVANTSIATPDVFERHYLAAMKRFASFAHLLPASQSHHHRGAGGLLRHAIEVGLWAMQSADRVLLDAAKTPAQRREMEPRWQLAVFLAGLCHDAGKPVTDLTVTDKDRTTTWSPITEDLFAWATKGRINAYFLTWREGRARQHTALSSLIGERIIGAETLSWIAGAETELVVWLMESLASNPSPTNLIHDLVIKADQTSVERDLKTMGVAMAGYDLGVPVERHLTDIMRRLVREGVWFINEPGARLWNIGGHIYLVWPSSGEDLARQVREDGVPGIPRTPDGILDMLVDRQIAFVREGAAPGDRFWKIAPAVLAAKIPDIKLTAIRLRDEAMVSAMPIPLVEGRIINELDAAQIQNAQDVVPPAPDVRLPSQTLDTGAHTDGQIEPPAAVGRLPEGDSLGEPALMDKGNGKTRPKAASTSSDASGPARNDAQMQKTPVATVTATVTAPATVNKPLDAVKPDGAVGEALKALAQDLKAGEKIWGRDAVVDVDGQVCLKWPDAFAGYGLTAKAILDDLHGREWLWIDPMAPLRKVLDAEFKTGVAKAIRLAPAISQWLTQEAGGSDALHDVSIRSQSHLLAENPPTDGGQRIDPLPEGSGYIVPRLHRGVSPTNPPEGRGFKPELIDDWAAKAETIEHQTKEASQEPIAPDTEAASPIATVEKPGRKSRRKADRQADTPKAHVVGPKPDECDGGAKQAPAVADVASGTPSVAPSIANVIALLKDLPAQAQLDGFLSLPKAEVMAACRKGGLKLTHKRLADLCLQEPDRLHVDGDVVRYKG